MPKMPGGDDSEKKEESAESREEAKEQVAFNIINDMITISTIINNIDIINIIIIMSMTMVGMMMMMTMNRKDFDSRRSRTRRRRELSFTQNRKLSYFTIRWMTNEAMTEIMMGIVKLMTMFFFLIKLHHRAERKGKGGSSINPRKGFILITNQTFFPSVQIGSIF